MQDFAIATTPLVRLRGLAFRRDPPEPRGLLFPSCRSVHTFGMRFALDLVWLDDAGNVLRVDRAVGPRRLRTCRAARHVLELPTTVRPAGSGSRFRGRHRSTS